MKTLKILVFALPLLGMGCVSATQYFGSRANRLIVTGDAYLRRNPGHYAPHVAGQYTRFLSGLPNHPSLDGIRVQILMKRAESFRAMNRQDLSQNDVKAASEIQARSPLSRSGAGPSALPPPHSMKDSTSTPLAAERPMGGRKEGFPPFAGAPAFPGMGQQEKPKVNLDVGVGIIYLNRRLIRSDSRSHEDFSYDLEGDLDVNLTTGFPRISLRMKPVRSKTLYGLDFWTAAFNGETETVTPFSYDGWTCGAGENLRTRVTYTSLNLFLGFCPSAQLLGKVDFEIGLKHVYMETRLHGSSSGRHVDSLHVPMIFPGIRVHHNVGRRVILGGILRAGAMIWATSGFSMLALGFEADLNATFKMNERLDLKCGLKFEHLSFTEAKSGDRRKQAGVGFGGGFLEAAFKF